ncbi:MAG: DUF1614 domain-containing protein [Planctomycetales bacterium]|nr:DUF1614 domain-containing protein [Planctomycetales bacterium]
MRLTPQNYFPVSPFFLVLLLFAFGLLVTLIEFNVLTYAYEKMGISRRYVFTILLLSLFGSGVNIPIAEFPAKDVHVDRVVRYFGMQYVVPQVERLDRTILAVNVGGCVIPVALSVYLLLNNPIFGRAVVAVGIVSVRFEGQTWPEAFVNTAMLLAAMGPLTAPKTDAGRIFAGCYALYCGLVFLFIAGLLVTPVAHRLLHLFHADPDEPSEP